MKKGSRSSGALHTSIAVTANNPNRLRASIFCLQVSARNSHPSSEAGEDCVLFLESGKPLSAFHFAENSLSQFGNDMPRSAIAIAKYETWLAPLQKNGSGRS